MKLSGASGGGSLFKSEYRPSRCPARLASLTDTGVARDARSADAQDGITTLQLDLEMPNATQIAAWYGRAFSFLLRSLSLAGLYHRS